MPLISLMETHPQYLKCSWSKEIDTNLIRTQTLEIEWNKNSPVSEVLNPSWSRTVGVHEQLSLKWSKFKNVQSVLSISWDKVFLVNIVKMFSWKKNIDISQEDIKPQWSKEAQDTLITLNNNKLISIPLSLKWGREKFISSTKLLQWGCNGFVNKSITVKWNKVDESPKTPLVPQILVIGWLKNKDSQNQPLCVMWEKYWIELKPTSPERVSIIQSEDRQVYIPSDQRVTWK
jgi:hypothetical protein